MVFTSAGIENECVLSEENSSEIYVYNIMHSKSHTVLLFRECQKTMSSFIGILPDEQTGDILAHVVVEFISP